MIRRERGLCLGARSPLQLISRIPIADSPDAGMNWQTFVSEMRRRNVYRAAVAYAVVGWLLIQIATQVMPIFEVPTWGIRLVVLLIVFGFAIALVFSWLFGLSAEGWQPSDQIEGAAEKQASSRVWIIVPAVAAFLSVGLFFLGRMTATNKQSDAMQIPAKSIAVLPFENLSSDKENDYFADGVQDEILTNLAKVADLKVISRTSVLQYRRVTTRNLREIGRDLAVVHLLEGTVQRAENKVRVNVHLIDARNGTDIWAQSYNDNIADLFTI